MAGSSGISSWVVGAGRTGGVAGLPGSILRRRHGHHLNLFPLLNSSQVSLGGSPGYLWPQLPSLSPMDPWLPPLGLLHRLCQDHYRTTPVDPEMRAGTMTYRLKRVTQPCSPLSLPQPPQGVLPGSLWVPVSAQHALPCSSVTVCCLLPRRTPRLTQPALAHNPPRAGSHGASRLLAPGPPPQPIAELLAARAGHLPHLPFSFTSDQNSVTLTGLPGKTSSLPVLSPGSAHLPLALRSARVTRCWPHISKSRGGLGATPGLGLPMCGHI